MSDKNTQTKKTEELKRKAAIDAQKYLRHFLFREDDPNTIRMVANVPLKKKHHICKSIDTRSIIGDLVPEGGLRMRGTLISNGLGKYVYKRRALRDDEKIIITWLRLLNEFLTKGTLPEGDDLQRCIKQGIWDNVPDSCKTMLLGLHPPE